MINHNFFHLFVLALIFFFFDLHIVIFIIVHVNFACDTFPAVENILHTDISKAFLTLADFRQDLLTFAERLLTKVLDVILLSVSISRSLSGFLFRDTHHIYVAIIRSRFFHLSWFIEDPLSDFLSFGMALLLLSIEDSLPVVRCLGHQERLSKFADRLIVGLGDADLNQLRNYYLFTKNLEKGKSSTVSMLTLVRLSWMVLRSSLLKLILLLLLPSFIASISLWNLSNC